MERARASGRRGVARRVRCVSKVVSPLGIVWDREGSKALLIISREFGVTGTIIVDSPGGSSSRVVATPRISNKKLRQRYFKLSAASGYRFSPLDAEFASALPGGEFKNPRFIRSSGS